MVNRKKLLLVVVAVVIAIGCLWLFSGEKKSDNNKPGRTETSNSRDVLVVTPDQAKGVKVEPAHLYEFVVQRDAVGYVDFNQDTTVQVLSPYAGRISHVFVKNGQDVKKGQPLYSIDSPDQVQAISALISTAGVRNLATRALERARKMNEISAISQKDLDQALSDQQAAEAAYQAARDALRIFGKTDAEMDKIIASKKVNGEFVINSPITGRVVARNASEGSLVQVGATPAPVTVADISSMWLIANAPEYDIPAMKIGQKVDISINALPKQKFSGQIVHLGESVDPNTRRIAVRTEIADPKHQLRQQMLATYVIQTGEPVKSVAIPMNGLVREGDGTMTVFVTQDGLKFERRGVKVGLEQDQMTQILEGLAVDEKVATDGAIFLSNALALQAR